MRFLSFALLACTIVTVNAHFQLSYPPPRGPFDEDNEVNFCDNYVDAVSNRSEFPLSTGFVTLNSEHPQWSLAILLSTDQDPTSFDNFTNSTGGQQLSRNFAIGSGEGGFCIPLNLSASGITGVTDGANVTIQLVYNGGDSSLYQCSDLTLSSNFTIPSNITCSNSSSTETSSTGTSTATSTAATSTSTGNHGAKGIATSGFASALGFLIVALITA